MIDKDYLQVSRFGPVHLDGSASQLPQNRLLHPLETIEAGCKTVNGSRSNAVGSVFDWTRAPSRAAPGLKGSRQWEKFRKVRATEHAARDDSRPLASQFEESRRAPVNRAFLLPFSTASVSEYTEV